MIDPHLRDTIKGGGVINISRRKIQTFSIDLPKKSVAQDGDWFVEELDTISRVAQLSFAPSTEKAKIHD